MVTFHYDKCDRVNPIGFTVNPEETWRSLSSIAPARAASSVEIAADALLFAT